MRGYCETWSGDPATGDAVMFAKSDDGRRVWRATAGARRLQGRPCALSGVDRLPHYSPSSGEASGAGARVRDLVANATSRAWADADSDRAPLLVAEPTE